MIISAAALRLLISANTYTMYNVQCTMYIVQCTCNIHEDVMNVNTGALGLCSSVCEGGRLPLQFPHHHQDSAH